MMRMMQRMDLTDEMRFVLGLLILVVLDSYLSPESMRWQKICSGSLARRVDLVLAHSKDPAGMLRPNICVRRSNCREPSKWHMKQGRSWRSTGGGGIYSGDQRLRRNGTEHDYSPIFYLQSTSLWIVNEDSDPFSRRRWQDSFNNAAISSDRDREISLRKMSCWWEKEKRRMRPESLIVTMGYLCDVMDVSKVSPEDGDDDEKGPSEVKYYIVKEMRWDETRWDVKEAIYQEQPVSQSLWTRIKPSQPISLFSPSIYPNSFPPHHISSASARTRQLLKGLLRHSMNILAPSWISLRVSPKVDPAAWAV